MPTKTLKIPQTLFRTATFERESVNEADRTVEMSVSSDVPYQRYFGKEILDHSPEAIDMSRMAAGAPLLFNHNRDAHIGRIMSARTDGKKMTVTAKFGNSPLANEKFQDVKDGILKETSVGYQVNNLKMEEEDDEDGDTYRATRWTPHEASLVTIPADITTGVGRGKENDAEVEINVDCSGKKAQSPPNQRNMPDPIAPPAVENQPSVQVVKEAKDTARREERERVAKINEFRASFKVDAMKGKVGELAEKAIAEGGDFDDFRRSILDNWSEATRIDNPTPDLSLGMSNKELRQYSIVKAVRELSDESGSRCLTGLEKEASIATAKLLKTEPKGFYIPEDYQSKSIQEIHGLGSRTIDNLAIALRTLTAGNFASAGALISTDLLTGSFIELLRNAPLLMQMGITNLSGLVGNILIPKQTGAGTAYWLAEGASVTESDQAYAQLGLTPHRLAGDTAYDKQLLAQSSMSVEALVRMDMAKVMGIAKDLAGIAGTGVNGQPLGILNTTGVQTVTFGGVADWAHLVSFETDLGTANAMPLGVPQWLTTFACQGKWKTNPKIGTTFPIFLQEGKEVNGYTVNPTQQVPGDRVLYFIPSEFICAEWAGIDVVVDPYSLKKTGQIEVTIQQFCDMAVRHPTAFVISTDTGAA